ncbi:DivIVA domain-containing protein [Shimazuella alba]|uniref:DivIVA domain-containing protein n=1 Tax=Shimazuella alba TaxID=2690964 RepID=A0A6I4VUT4_9BACL|nr:DivIVA domain-containing protein [Shimazuella alba]
MKRLTPMEIFNKDFKQSMRGYDVNEVNEFLDLVIRSYEDILKENEYLKEQLTTSKKQNTARHKAVQANMSEYDAIINEILTRLERIEKVMR